MRRSTRIAKVVTGIALAMRFVHSRGAAHRDLTPENILLDWDWTVRIANFGRSTTPPDRASPTGEKFLWDRPQSAFGYLAPEWFDETFRQASDVFAFGVILFEILTRTRALANRMYIHRTREVPSVILDKLLPLMRR